jgi:hypothetical protein
MSDQQFVHRRRSVDPINVGQTKDAPLSMTVPAQYVSEATVARNRRVPRSQELLDAIAKIDADPSALASREIMDWVREQYKERGGGEVLGLFARCHLGPPFVDHVMSLTGYICEHFRREDPVPKAYEAVRNLAANPAYDYIEVYDDGEIVPVRSDGRAF